MRCASHALSLGLRTGLMLTREAANTVYRLEHLRWINEQIREATSKREYQRLLTLNIDFHEAICRASRNSMLMQFMSQIHDWVRRFPTTTLSHPGRAATAVLEHDALLDALARRDPEAAEHVARAHMDRAMQVRVSMLQAGTHTAVDR